MIIRQETKTDYQEIYNLVQTAFKTAKAAFLCGDPNYYHRFGFKSISEYGLTNPEIPEPYVMGYELMPAALDNVTGVVKLV